MERVIYRGPGFCAVTEDGTLVEYLERDVTAVASLDMNGLKKLRRRR